MEKSNPAKYKGLVSKFTGAIKARQAYEAAWIAENPGKEFDPEAEEHNDFFAKNDVDWKDRDYNSAIVEIGTAKVRSELEKKTDKQIGELTARDRARELEPLAISESKKTGRTLFAALGDDFKDVLSEAGVINFDAVKKAQEADPVKAKLVFEYAQSLETLAAENVRLFNGIVPFDEANSNHAYLEKYVHTQETAMEQLSLDEKKNAQGKMFSPLKDYYKMTKSEQAKHWTFSAADLNTLLAADTIRAVKATILADEQMLEARAVKRGFKKEAKEELENPPEKAKEKDVELEEKPQSPSSVEAQFLSTSRRNGGVPLKGGLNAFAQRFVGR